MSCIFTALHFYTYFLCLNCSCPISSSWCIPLQPSTTPISPSFQLHHWEINQYFLCALVLPCIYFCFGIYPMVLVILFLFWDLFLDYNSLRARAISYNIPNALHNFWCRASTECTDLCIVLLCFVFICKNKCMVTSSCPNANIWEQFKT